jgi:hypothetical protein
LGAWQEPGAGKKGRDAVIQGWVAMMGWNVGAQVCGVDLSGEVPGLLARQFETLYMACPAMPDWDWD